MTHNDPGWLSMAQSCKVNFFGQNLKPFELPDTYTCEFGRTIYLVGIKMTKSSSVALGPRLSIVFGGRFMGLIRIFSQMDSYGQINRIYVKIYLWKTLESSHLWLSLAALVFSWKTSHSCIPDICHFFSTYPIFYKNFLHAKARTSRQNGSHKNSVKLTLWQKTG